MTGRRFLEILESQPAACEGLKLRVVNEERPRDEPCALYHHVRFEVDTGVLERHLVVTICIADRSLMDEWDSLVRLDNGASSWMTIPWRWATRPPIH
jgi:hypothetical protein